MKRVTWVVPLLILCTTLTFTACKKPKDPPEESMQLPSSESVSQTETELASDTVHVSDAADSTAAPTESTEAPTEASEPPESDTTVPQSSEQASEPAPTESAKATEPKPTEPKPTEPTEPKPTEPTPTQPKPTEPAPTQPKPTEPAPPPTEPPHVHSWSDWKQTIAPTCAAVGEETRTCTGCGATESRSVAATGIHSWQETAPTCTQEGKKTCTVCGTKESIPALGHDWVHHEEEGHWQVLVTCYCGAQFSSSAEWEAHASASDDLAYLNAHAGYEAHEVWQVDKPASDVCSRCGAIK